MIDLLIGDLRKAARDLHDVDAVVAFGSIARSVSLPCTPSTAATALELVTRCSKLVQFDVKADVELVIAPYRAELLRTPNLLRAHRMSSHLLLSGTSRRNAFVGDRRDVVFVITYVHDRSLFLQARPARAVQVGNTSSGALEDNWVDVGQIDAATTAITGL